MNNSGQFLKEGLWVLPEGVACAGRARRGLSVIVGLEIDVNVNENGHLRGKTGRPFDYLSQYGSIC